MATHLVTNQVAALCGYNLYRSDPVLASALARLGGGWHAPALDGWGARLGGAELQEMAELANHVLPELRTHSPNGERIDSVRFHPAWHQLLGLLRQAQLHALPFACDQAGAWVARTAGYFLAAQNEAGSLCPTTMTFASIPLLQREPLFRHWGPKLLSGVHDARDLPWRQKVSVLIGMGMTEKQGGSDLRSNATLAMPESHGGRGESYRLIGHKWFFSAPMSDAHLVLAREGSGEGALSCFLVPRWARDGRKNAVEIQRLKDKLGNRSNASAEVEFRSAEAVLVGEPGRGIQTLIEMATYTRLDCVIGSAALLRQGFVRALHHARARMAFGRRLAEQPLMLNVLADLALESEAATLLMMQLADAFGRAGDDLRARAYMRILTPAAKFWVCKRAIEATAEAMEVCGGNGYVEDGVMARLYREAPVNSIWEGAGNVMCLDVLRAIRREPEAFACLLEDLAAGAAGDKPLRHALGEMQALPALDDAAQQFAARTQVRTLVLLVQGVLMRRFSARERADAFIHGRLGSGSGPGLGGLGALDAGSARDMLEALWPA